MPEESTKIWTEKVVVGAHKGRIYMMGSQNDVRRLQFCQEGIGLSRQAEAIDDFQIADVEENLRTYTCIRRV